ncbi:probable protein ECT2 at N-terminal half [Coccomyxa sp. Obi]|nr:probable protein ECT2 at N-terminal half [Coccomyxa sp. Obi]
MSALIGTNICCTGIASIEERANLERMIHELGGTCVSGHASKPHVFVANSVQSEEYKASKTLPMIVPVVRPTWVQACHSAGRKVPLKAHELGPFDGLTISTSGHNAAEKESLGNLIKQGCGEYAKNMTRACTHLVIKTCGMPRTISEKERHAHAWGTIKIVWDSWLQQTAHAGVYSANEEQFAVPFSQREPAQCQPPLRAPPQQLTTGPALVSVSDAAAQARGSDMAPQQPQRPASVSAPIGGTAASREPGQPAMSGGPAQQSTDSLLRVTSTGLQQHTLTHPTRSAEATAPAREAVENGSRADGPHSGAHTAQPSTSMQPAHSEEDAFSSGRSPAPGRALTGGRERFVAGPPSETFTFLDGLRIFLACCASNEIMELACICREGGACRYPQLNPLITHIVVGSDLMMDELQCIKQHQQKHGALVRVLDAGWLRQCGAVRAREDETAWLFNPASALAAGPRKSREGSDLLDNRESSRAGFQGASDCDGDASRHARVNGAAIGRGPFSDCWFTLAALEHDPREKGRMHDLIRQAGGRIFDAKRVNLVASASAAYAVCPLGFPPNQLAEVMRQPDFRMVPEANRVTAYWVELSIDRGAPIKQLGRTHVTCTPLPYQLPMAEMENVKLCASGMPDDAKLAIKELVKHLGGKYTQKMSRHNTHLIIQKAMGDKWKHATAFGVIPVTPDWLVDSARAGRLLPESNYVPPPPAPGEEDLNAATQFPFEMTARPAATQHRPQAPPARTAPEAAAAQPDALNASRTAPTRAEPSSGLKQDDTLLQRMMSHSSASDHGQHGSMLEAALGTKSGSQKRSTAPPSKAHESGLPAREPEACAARGPLEDMLDSGSRAGLEPTGAGLPSPSRGRQKSRLQNMQALSRAEPMDDQENGSQRADAGNKGAEWALAAARLGNFLEAVAPPNLASSQQDAFTHPAHRASSAGSGRQGVSLGQRPGEASAGEATSLHSGDSTGLSHGRKRSRTGAAGGAASSGAACKRANRAGSAAPADTHAPSPFDCSQQVGYGGAGKIPPSVTTRRRAALNAKSGLGGEGKGSEELAKQRLARAVRSSVRKDAGKNEDALKAMGLID